MNIFLQVDQYSVLIIIIKTTSRAVACKVHHESKGLHLAIVSVGVERPKHVGMGRMWLQERSHGRAC